MKLSLKPEHLKRYKELAQLFFRYGRSEVVDQLGFAETIGQEDMPTAAPETAANPEQLARDLEKMGPTFIKVGQLLSSRIDLLPPSYIQALSRLQDDVAPFPYKEVEAIVTSELGVRISKAFSSFDQEPLAAASLGQVHRAALRDGREVVVKVQRPNIRKQIADDLEFLGSFIEFLDEHSELARRYQFVKIFEEFRQTLLRELDYQREAANLRIIRNNLKEFPKIRIPAPVEDYSTSSVLTMEYIHGRKITAVGPLARLDIDGSALAEELFRAYLQQVLVDGLFHADPHPGNVYLTEDGKIALLDLGMVGRTSQEMQDHLLKLLLAISDGQSDNAAEIVIRISETTPQFNQADFRRTVASVVLEHQHDTLQKIDVGKALLGVGKSASLNGLYVPTDLTLLGKAILQLEEIGRSLDEKFNPTATIRNNVGEILNRRLRKSVSPAALVSSMLEMKDFMGHLPSRLNRILDTVANAEFQLKVTATDTNEIIQGFHRIANRITAGLILAALIVGAALLMQVHTEFRIFGYPGLAMLCFLLAAAGGLWLLYNIFVNDRRTRKKPPR